MEGRKKNKPPNLVEPQQSVIAEIKPGITKRSPGKYQPHRGAASRLAPASQEDHKFRSGRVGKILIVSGGQEGWKEDESGFSRPALAMLVPERLQSGPGDSHFH